MKPMNVQGEWPRIVFSHGAIRVVERSARDYPDGFWDIEHKLIDSMGDPSWRHLYSVNGVMAVEPHRDGNPIRLLALILNEISQGGLKRPDEPSVIAEPTGHQQEGGAER